MKVFISTLDQMGFLFLLIIIGYILGKTKALPDNSVRVLSRLENTVFIPALVLGTFVSHFTRQKISEYGSLLLCGLAVQLIVISIAVICSKFLTKDAYIRGIYTYGLAFANFAFMGNAVVEALFPEIFLEYLIFVIPFWIFIYIWGVPKLLIPQNSEQRSFYSKLLTFLNPMFIGMAVGIILGLSSLPLPSFITRTVSTLGNCMSPVAMLLTGITVSLIDIRKTFKMKPIYIASLIRLAVIPALAIALLYFVPLPTTYEICVICSLSMPLGLNSIVVPAAYGMDTSDASGMALISHILSCLTIPLVFFVSDILLFR